VEFEWVQSYDQLHQISLEIEKSLEKHNVLAVDLEYYGVEKFATVLSLVQLSTCDKDYIIDSLQLRDDTKYAGLRQIM
jgi:ribonuclease D